MSSSGSRFVGRVRGRGSFAALHRDGSRRRSGPIMITALRDDAQAAPRVAFAIPRSVGTAVVRNRLRRRLRAATRELDLAPGTYLVSARPAAADLSYAALTVHLREACGR